MSFKSYLVRKTSDIDWFREYNRLFLLNNLSLVNETLQKDLDLCAVVPRLIPPRSKATIATLDLQARLISDCMRTNPREAGYPVVDTEGIMYYYRDKIQVLCDASGLTEEEQEEHLIYHIRSLASCVHLIPASNENHHRGMGGLFEHSIESATFAAQTAKDYIFPTEEENHKIIPKNRWIVGAILGILFHDLGKVMVNVNIHINEPKRETFNPYSDELTPWLLERLGFGSKYYVQWIPAGNEHDQMRLLMATYHPPINPKTVKWLGGTVLKELGFLLINKPYTTYRTLRFASDNKSARENLQHGQFQNMPGTTSEEKEVELAFETIKQMLKYGDLCKNADGEPEEFETNGLKLRGWSINTHESAVVYADLDHLYIIWEDFMKMRIDYEMGQRDSEILRTSQNSCLSIEGKDWFNEFTVLTQLLNDKNYLQTHSAKDGNELMLWNVRRINQKTGEIDAVPHQAICFNDLGIKKIFKGRKRPPANQHLLSVNSESSAEPSKDVPLEAEKAQESTNDPSVQDQSTEGVSQEQIVPPVPNNNDFPQPSSGDKSKPKKQKAKKVIEEGIADGPPKKTFADLGVKMIPDEIYEAAFWERESDKPSGMACIVKENGVTYITGESVHELCKQHGCDFNSLKHEPSGRFKDYCYFDDSDALVFTEKKYYRKSKLAENVAN